MWSESVVVALLVIVTAAFAIGSVRALPFHAAMLVLFIAVVALSRVMRWPDIVPIAAIVAVLMTLYQSLAEPAFILMGRGFDANLAHIDRALFFGRDPALLAERFASFPHVEFFSLVYGFFIPYLWLSIILGCLGRPATERSAFVLGLSITYAFAYLGYLFVPSRGPVEFYAFHAPLHGGRFLDIVLKSVAATGGNHGAFPSLHVGASAYLCMFDLRRNLIRGLTYLPLVVLISFSTVLLRYHYVADVITGLAIAFLAQHVAQREVAR